MPTCPIQLYAELLANIRQVSVSVSLQSPVDNASTVIELVVPESGAGGASKLRVQHAGVVREMKLPGEVATTGRSGSSGSSGMRSRLPLPMTAPGQVPPSYLTWRLPLTTKATPVRDSSRTQGLSADDLVPWSAPELRPESRVLCRSCDAVVVAAGKIHEWKDLPSDNWAEMMEFWHCHKPSHNHEPKASGHGAEAPEDNLVNRGYGANNVILAHPGVGFVDLIALIFAERDCQGLLFSECVVERASAQLDSLVQKAAPAAATAAPRGLNVFCKSCRAQIGYFNHRMQAVNLFKWRILCTTTTQSSTIAAPSLSECVAATLVATIARTGSSKSVIMPIDDLPDTATVREQGDRVLQVWVLNTNICYTSSQSVPDGPVSAIKLLFKIIDKRDADDLVVKLDSDLQEINLPEDTIRVLMAQLEASQKLLPSRERTFKEWGIGLIKRWDPRRPVATAEKMP